MSMTKVLFRRGRRPVAMRARTAGPPHRTAIVSALCLALCGLPAAGAKAQRGMHGGDFHGREFGHFGPGELRAWRGGAWRHEWHDGRFAWWWVVGGGWYFYPEPIWPYPTYVPPAIVLPPALSAWKFNGLTEVEVRLDASIADGIHIREVKLRAVDVNIPLNFISKPMDHPTAAAAEARM